jgi:hypothetical protein
VQCAASSGKGDSKGYGVETGWASWGSSMPASESRVGPLLFGDYVLCHTAARKKSQSGIGLYFLTLKALVIQPTLSLFGHGMLETQRHGGNRGIHISRIVLEKLSTKSHCSLKRKLLIGVKLRWVTGSDQGKLHNSITVHLYLACAG